MALVQPAAVPVRNPMLPVPYRIRGSRRELADTFTVELEPETGDGFAFRPGQFNMLYVFGVGEVPISISGDPARPEPLVHTVRAVGAVTEAMRAMRPGETIGVRGPFGSAWPVAEAEGDDLVFVAGGLGLAPLRPAIYHALANRRKYGRIVILYGARTPRDILYRRELEKWRGRFDLEVAVTVDSAGSDWAGNVGVVTKLIGGASFDPLHTTAFVCGPEIMMRYSIATLRQQDVAAESIHVSMERNMKCAVGFCGHCQWGPAFICKDGPVFRYADIADLFTIREL